MTGEELTKAIERFQQTGSLLASLDEGRRPFRPGIKRR